MNTMKLQLTANIQSEGPVLKEPVKAFEQCGGTIGRGSDCDWCIDDPNRLISMVHIVIEYNAGQYIVFDKSTNGLYINDSKSPLGQMAHHLLVSGDTLRLGAVLLTATLEPMEAPFTTAWDDLFDPTQLGMKVTQQATPSVSNGHDAWGAPQPLLGESPLSAGTTEQVDPLLALGGGVSGGNLRDSLAERSEPRVGDLSGAADLWHEPMPGVGALQALIVPEPLQDNGLDGTNPKADEVGLIPEHWDISCVKAAPNTQKPLAPEIKPLASEIQPLANDSLSDQLANSPDPVITPQPDNSESNSRVPPNGIDTLIQALGLEVKQFSPEQKAALIPLVAQVVRSSVGGLLEALQARAAVKNEQRMEMTMIAPADNNPLKFSVSVEDALSVMFTGQSPAYQSAPAAIDEAIQDLVAHQATMVEQERTRWRIRMEQRTPTFIKQALDQQQRHTPLLKSRKAALWDLFETLVADQEKYQQESEYAL